MATYKVILGKAACRCYDETQDLKKVQEVIKEKGGDIKTIEFGTEDEYKAYLRGLWDGNGWEEYWVLKENGEPA